MNLSAYLARHLQALLASLGRLLRYPFASAMTVLVIAVSLVIPVSLGLLIENLRDAAGGLSDAIEISVFLKKDTALTTAQQLAEKARARPDVLEATLISADQGLAEFKNDSGFGAALDALAENPLPHVVRVRPRAVSAGAAQVEALRRYFAAWPEVDAVQLDMQWVERLNAFLDLARLLVALAGAVLGAGILAIVGNTVRLEVANRRAEIEVTKLVGGSNAFVRRPFLYIGALYGLLGALLAWIMVAAALKLLEAPISHLAALYDAHFRLAGLNLVQAAALAATGLALGALGAWMSASHHLRRLEPRA